MTDRGVVVEWEENVTLFTQFTHEAFGLAFLMVQRQRELRQKKKDGTAAHSHIAKLILPLRLLTFKGSYHDHIRHMIQS